MTGTAQAIRGHRGLALFSGGFRPFFLFASLWGAVVAPIWVAALHLNGGLVAGLDGRAWHVHEMLFGFLCGVIAGFLLTAIPNWTGRLPVTGRGLAGLFGLWVAGRLASFAPPALAPLAAVVDASFLVVFALVVWREIIAGRNRRNLPVCLMVTLLAAANILYHVAPWLAGADQLAQRLALALAAGLLSLIGGRIVPSFTQNWLGARKIAPGPTPFGRYDAFVLALTVLALGAWIIAPFAAAAGWLLAGAGVAHTVRLLRWRGWKARGEPLVWILHIGYAWLALGLGLIGAGVLAPSQVPATLGVHALGAGAVGVMTLAVMTRATLGHTGRPREADRRTVWIYLAVLAAALTRLCAPLHDNSPVLLAVSAGLWTLAFGGFALVYGPLLIGQRAGRAG
ncbi:NnrS family protein [Phenylobacterium sp.]|uniref:NnrS family protein n=1 Tax=Phenylobacterium sp. TaxID=1871053 RepID=UPI0035B3063D